jgi:hypothetical protein
MSKRTDSMEFENQQSVDFSYHWEALLRIV